MGGWRKRPHAKESWSLWHLEKAETVLSQRLWKEPAPQTLSPTPMGPISDPSGDVGALLEAAQLVRFVTTATGKDTPSPPACLRWEQCGELLKVWFNALRLCRYILRGVWGSRTKAAPSVRSKFSHLCSFTRQGVVC